MNDVTMPQKIVLAADQAERVAASTRAVLEAADPVAAMRAALQGFAEAQTPLLSAALYDSVAWRARIDDYWVCFAMARAYGELGPAWDQSRLQLAMQALRLHPDWSGHNQLWGDVFGILSRRGEVLAAAEAYQHALAIAPERPPAGLPGGLADVLPVFAAAGLPSPCGLPRTPRAGARTDHRAVAPSERPGWTCPVFGGAMPYMLRGLASGASRPAIDIAELTDAQVLLCDDAVVVLDRDGMVHHDLSVCDFPDQVRAKLDRLESSATPPALYEVARAVVISDRFPPPNLCHFLLDQITRLALYRMAGVATDAVTVIGPAATEGFQCSILRLAGVTEAIGTAQVARVRVGRLFVATNCRDLRHAAHLGAGWAIEAARTAVGGRGKRGWRRLYLSRADVKARQVANEAEVMAMLRPHGFEEIRPGTMPYEAQVTAFQQASHVIGAHGAALTHMILCPAQAHILEMFHPLYGTPAFAMQAAEAGLAYAALLARDAQSDAPDYNDPDRPGVSRTAFIARHMRVDLDSLSAYLATVT